MDEIIITAISIFLFAFVWMVTGFVMNDRPRRCIFQKRVGQRLKSQLS